MDKGIDAAVLGVRYLIKYATRPNSAYFPVILDCAKEIKLWCLITLFSNNMDELWEGVPDFIFEDLFLMREIDTTEGVLKYGRGYSSESTLPYRLEFKRIRDYLSHMNFTYEDGLIYLHDDAHTWFDLIWLEKLVLCTISNEKGKFKKGMSDIAVLSFIPKKKDVLFDFDEYWKMGIVKFYKITLLNGNKSTLANYFSGSGIPEDRYTFDLLFSSVKYKIGNSSIHAWNSFESLIQELELLFKRIEKHYGNYIKLDLLPTPQFSDVFHDEGFKELTFQGKQQYLINKLKLEDPVSYNSIITHNILDILNSLEEGHEDKDQLYILRDAKDFLLKVYANILFSKVYLNKDYDVDLKMALQKEFSFDTHYVYAKNIYQEYLRVLNRAYEEAKEYSCDYGYIKNIVTLSAQYSKLLEEVLNNDIDKHLFWNLRNAIIHNQVEFSGSKMRLYITGSNIHLKHYQKKKKEWVDKEFRNNRVIWEMIIDKEEFLRLMDKLYELENIQFQINISKYMRKKIKEESRK